MRVIFVRAYIKNPIKVFLDFSTPRFAGNDCQSYFEEINYVYFRYTYASTPILNCGNNATNLKLSVMEYCEIMESIKTEVAKAKSLEEILILANHYFTIYKVVEDEKIENAINTFLEDYREGSGPF